MAKTATKEKPAAKTPAKTKTNVAEFPKGGKKNSAKPDAPAPEDTSAATDAINDAGETAPPDIREYPVEGISNNALIAFDFMRKNSVAKSKFSFDEISDATDFSFDELNGALKELEERNLIGRLPELEYEIKPLESSGAPNGGNESNPAENEPEGGEAGESYDILKEVDGSKLKDAVKSQEEETERRTHRLPRQSKLPEMENAGIPELEKHALDHEDCAHTIKLMKKKMETMRAEMLDIMQKKDIENYSHSGFVIKLEDKGKNVKVVSVQVKDDE